MKLDTGFNFNLPYKNPLAAIGVCFIFFLLVRGMIENETAALEKVRNSIKDLAQQEDLISRWATLKAQDESVNSAFSFKALEEVKLLIEDAARLNNIRITRLSPKSSKKHLFSEIQIDLIIGSSYTNLVKFIKALEEKFIEVNDLSISEGSLDKLTITLKGIILEAK